MKFVVIDKFLHLKALKENDETEEELILFKEPSAHLIVNQIQHRGVQTIDADAQLRRRVGLNKRLVVKVQQPA